MIDLGFDAGDGVEAALLGALLLDREAIVPVSELLPRADLFSKPKHQIIYGAMLALWARREPIDPVTLEAQLGADPTHDVSLLDLTDLMGAVPTAVHAPYYARTVRNAATLRAIQQAYVDLVRTCRLDPTRDPAAELAALAQQLLAAHPDASGPRGYDLLIPEAVARIVDEQAGIRPDAATPSGFPALDELIGGFAPGELIVVGARPSIGKALALDTPIPTPAGWSTMGALRAGDWVFDDQGRPCRVTAATPVLLNRTCYRLRFSDGAEIVADADHRWLTSTRQARKSAMQAARWDRLGRRPDSPFSRDQSSKRVFPAVVTTAEIAATLRAGRDGRLNHCIDAAGPLLLPHADLPIPPYTLGAWLGDGTSAAARITVADAEILDHIRVEGIAVGPPTQPRGKAFVYRLGGVGRRAPQEVRRTSLSTRLREAGLTGNKHIPAAYLRASRAQRLALLCGLMDTDGSVDKRCGVCEFSTANPRLAAGVRELVLTLGWVPHVAEKRAKLNGRDCGPAWRVYFSPDEPVFNLMRKRERQWSKPRPKAKARRIEAVEPVPSVPVRCIEVDSPSHLYLAGEAMIPTHNSALCYDFLRVASRRGQALLYSAEMSAAAITRRGISRETGIPFATLDREKLTPGQYAAVMHASERLAHLPLVVDETPGITSDQMLVRTQRALAAGPVALVAFDYLELAGDQLRDPSTERKIAHVTQQLKALAMACHVPVIALSQIGRGVEQRQSFVPRLADLAWSSTIEKAADKVILLYRHDYYVERGMADYDHAKAGTCDLIVAKQRNGPTGQVTLRYDGPTFRFSSLAEAPAPWESR